MKLPKVSTVILIAAAGAGALWVLRRSVAEVAAAVNPFSADNVIYRGAEKLADAVEEARAIRAEPGIELTPAAKAQAEAAGMAPAPDSSVGTFIDQIFSGALFAVPATTEE